MELALFNEISFLIAIATFIGLIMHLLRQPLIIGYILTGVLAGPTVFNIVQSEDTVDIFAKMGIALLLFIIGLGLNPQVIREVGKAAVLTGVGQVFFTTAIGFGIVRILGFSAIEAIYISIALAFSSTIIILKLLTDKKEQGRLYGKISIGFLLVQDIIATIALIVVTTAGDGTTSHHTLLELGLKGLIVGSLLYLFSTKLLAHLSTVIAGSQEFLFLFAIGWGLGIAALFARLGFSLEVGALFAGVALAPMIYSQEIASRLRPLRDFFIVLFFIALGAGLNIDNMLEVIPHSIILSLFVLIGNPIIVILVMGMLGYTKKTSFKAGLTVAQISEFSLVFVLLGRDLGSISDEIVSLVTMVALITIAASTYMILHADKLFDWCEKYLKMFENRIEHDDHERQFAIILLGYKKGGAEFIKIFQRMKKKFAVIDYDPDIIDHLEHTQIPYIYGDVMDIELLQESGIDHAKLIVCTITDHATSTFITQQIHRLNKRAVLICQADSAKDAAELYALGATYVMMPHYIGSERIGTFIKKNGLNKAEFKKFRDKHLSDLESNYELYN